MPARALTWMLTAAALLLIAACGSSSSSTTTTTPTPGSTPFVMNNEGSINSPLALALSGGTVTHSGTVGPGGISAYTVTGVTAGTYYTAAFSNLSDDIQMAVFDTLTFINTKNGGPQLCSSGSSNKAAFSCLAAASSNVLYIGVLGVGTTANETFTLTVTQVTTPPANEGVIGTEIALTPGAAVRASHVGIGQSYYSFTPAANTTYMVLLQNTNGGNGDNGSPLQVAIPVTESAPFVATSCKSLGSVGLNLNCRLAIGSPAPTSIKVVVDGSLSNFGSAYDLSVIQAPPLGEGTPTLPQALALGTPHTGALGTGSFSYYSVAGVSTSSVYQVTLTQSQNQPILMAWDPTFSGQQQFCNNNNTGGTLACLVKPQGTTMYLTAGPTLTPTGITGTITVAAITAPASEGTAVAPLALGAPALQHHGSVVASGTSYYTVPVTAHGIYNITTTSDNSPNLFVSNTGFNDTTPICNSSSNVCAANPTGTTLYIAATDKDSSNTGLIYLLTVSENRCTVTAGCALPLPPTCQGDAGTPSTPLSLGAVPTFAIGCVSSLGVELHTVPVTAGQGYQLVLSGIFGAVEALAFNSATADLTSLINNVGGAQPICQIRNLSNNNANCLMTAGATNLNIVELGAGLPLGATYIMQLRPMGAGLAEGSASSPIMVCCQDNNIRRVDTTTSYYTTNTTTPAAIAITNASNPQLSVIGYSNADFSTGQVCTDQGSANGDMICYISATNASPQNFYFTVSGASTTVGATYNISVTQPAISSSYLAQGAGSNLASQTFALSTYATGFGANAPASGFSQYGVTGLTTGTPYIFQAVQTAGQVSLAVYGDSAFTSLLCRTNGFGSATLTKVCRAVAPAAGSLYFRVGPAEIDTGALSVVTVAAGSTTSYAEGTASVPLDIGSGSPTVLRTSTVDGTASYYQVTGVSSSNAYLIRLSGPEAPIGLSAANTSFSGSPTLICSSAATNSSADDQTCIVQPSGTTLFIKVDGTTTGGAGGTFKLQARKF